MIVRIKMKVSPLKMTSSWLLLNEGIKNINPKTILDLDIVLLRVLHEDTFNLNFL